MTFTETGAVITRLTGRKKALRSTLIRLWGRRPIPGMLLYFDGSKHGWLKERRGKGGEHGSRGEQTGVGQ